MDCFILRPDFTTIIKYCYLSIPDDRIKDIIEYLRERNDDIALSGIPVGITHLGQDQIDSIKVKFDKLVEDNGLCEHRDNLLYLIASAIESFTSNHEMNQYDKLGYEQRPKELAAFLYALGKSNHSKFKLKLNYTRKDTGVHDHCFVNDEKLINWIGKLITREINECGVPIGLFGVKSNSIMRVKGSKPITLAELREVASTPLKNKISPFRKQVVGRLCIVLQDYLNKETHLHKRPNAKHSNKQLEFIGQAMLMFDAVEQGYDSQGFEYPIHKSIQTLINDTNAADKKTQR